MGGTGASVEDRLSSRAICGKVTSPRPLPVFAFQNECRLVDCVLNRSHFRASTASMFDGLADVHLEHTDPASHEVVDCRSNPPADCTSDAIYDGKKMIAPKPNMNPNGRPPVP